MTGAEVLLKILDQLEEFVEQTKRQTALLEGSIGKKSQKATNAQEMKASLNVPEAYPLEIYKACYTRPKPISDFGRSIQKKPECKIISGPEEINDQLRKLRIISGDSGLPQELLFKKGLFRYAKFKTGTRIVITVIGQRFIVEKLFDMQNQR